MMRTIRKARVKAAAKAPVVEEELERESSPTGTASDVTDDPTLEGSEDDNNKKDK